MKISDLTIEDLKKYVEIKGLSGLSEEGDKKELCERILNYAEQQIIKEIQQYCNHEIVLKEPQRDPMDVNDELGKELQNFIVSHKNEKTKILKSYDDLQNQKQKLKERIEQQKQTLLKFPSILRFNGGREVSISKSFLEKYPNSLLYTLISNSIWFKKFQENENKFNLNCTESEMIKIIDYLRVDNISSPEVRKIWGFFPIKYSNTNCLELDDKEFKLITNIKEDYQNYKKFIENEIKYQSDLLTANVENYQKQLKSLNELVYNDPIFLNVGGQIFIISKTILQKHENTYFSPLVSGQWELENNTHFIDRSYHHFHIIRDYLALGKLNSHSHQYFNSLNEKDQNIFLQEVDYYRLDKILNSLKYDFSESKILDKEELKYLQNRFPGKWRLLRREEITEKIEQTTILIKNTTNHPNPTLQGMYIKHSENFVDLISKKGYSFELLSADRRGEQHSWIHRKIPLRNCLIKYPNKNEIYVKMNTFDKFNYEDWNAKFFGEYDGPRQYVSN